MNRGNVRIGFTVVGVILGFAALVFAYDNYGYGGHMMGGGGQMMAAVGGHNHGDTGNYDEDGDVTQEQADKFKKTQQAFYQDTRELRKSIKGKRVAIDNELQKQNPDSSIIISLQIELSQIEAQYDMKAIEHQLELRKQLPQSAFNEGYGMYCW